jgi:hypothetical protein
MNSINRENVLDGITDLNSVYLLRDDDIKNRLEFLKATMLTDNWFDDHVFIIFKLLRTAANQKGLFNPTTRSSSAFREAADKTIGEIIRDPNRSEQRIGLIM